MLCILFDFIEITLLWTDVITDWWSNNITISNNDAETIIATLLTENNELEVIIYISLKDIYRGFSWGYVLKVWKIIFWNDKNERLLREKIMNI